MPKAIDETGNQYSRLYVKKRVDWRGRKNTYFLCICKCGNEKVVSGSDLRKGNTKSCGCLALDTRTTHGLSKIPEYPSWVGMHDRCNNPNNVSYADYGGRDIRVCERWENIETFIHDMGPRPSPEHTIDRIDNDGDYEPNNCRWATRRQQQNNRRGNVLVEYKGEMLTVAQLSRRAKIKINPDAMRGRLKLGWTLERAMTEPVKQGRRRVRR